MLPSSTATRPTAGLLATGAAIVAAAGLVAVGGVAPADAAPSKSCSTSGAKVLKKQGSSVAYTRKKAKEGVVYYACSSKYGKVARLTADASSLDDVIFDRKSLTLSSTKATLEFCETADDGTDCYTATANLKTGKTKTVKESGGDGGGS